MTNYINIGEENMNANQFADKIENYDVEITRNDLQTIVSQAKNNNPADIPLILSSIQKAYHLNLSL